MNRDIPGDSFTLEDIIKEFGGGKKNAAPEQTLPDGLSLSDIEQELRDLLGEDDLPAQDAASETLPEPEKLPETEETPEPEAQPEPEAVSAPEARTEAEEVPDTAPPEPEKPSEPGEPPAVTEEPDGQLHWMEEPEPEEPWSAKTDAEAWPPAPIEEPVKKRKKRRPILKKRPMEPKQTVLSDLYRDDYFALRAQEEDCSLRKAEKRGKSERRVKLPELPTQVRSAERTVQEVERGENSLYLRLRICLVVTAVNVLLALYNGIGLHWIRGFENVNALSVISLLLLAVAAGVAHDVLREGIRQIRSADFGVQVFAVLLCAAAIPETVFAIRALRLNLCALSSVVILVTLWATDCKAQALRSSALTMTEAGLDAADVGRADDVWSGGSAAVVIPDERRALEAMLDAEDPQKKAASVAAPAAVVLTLLLSAVGAIVGKLNFFRIWTAMLAASAPIGAVLSYALPFRLTARRLSRVRAVMGGWPGARLLQDCEAMFIDDPLLFPGQSLKLSGVKVFGEFDSVQVMQYCAAVLEQIGSHVVDRLAMFDDVLPPVQALRCYDEGGVGGEIGPDSVLVGTWRFMQRMGVHMEDGTRIRQALYVSVRGELAGLIALRYEAAPKVRETLEKLVVGAETVQPVLTGSDVLISRGMLQSKFRQDLEDLVCPPLRQRLEFSRAGERGAVPCALLGKPSLESFTAAVNGARALSRCTRICLVLGALAALLGIGVLFYLAVTGALDAVSCAKMLLFMCVWGLLSAAALIPVLKK